MNLVSRKERTQKKEIDLCNFKEAIRKYYTDEKFEVNFPSLNIPVGNAQIDGEIIRKDGFKIAVELKGPGDTDVVKGIGQLVEAAIHGYHQAILVVTEKRARTIRREVFEKIGIGLVTVSAEGNVKFLVQARDLKF